MKPGLPTMNTKWVFVGVLLILSAGLSTCQESECKTSQYRHEGVCTPCPDRCATCISDLNCTECNANYYGPVCQYTCQGDCKDHCHKVYGYCTEGCLDGFFPVPNSLRCADCPAQCKKCKSMTECLECIPGYYGNTCENQCFSNCDYCNKTTGACLVCDERYLNRDGRCRRCPDGCASCYGSDNCSRCEEGYSQLIDGQCMKDCSTGITNAALDTIASEYMVSHLCAKLIKGQDIEIKTSQPCIQYIPCSSNINCPSENNGKSGCGTIKTYQCSHVSRGANEKKYTFEHSCILIENIPITLCFTNTKKEAFSFGKLSTESECFMVSEDPQIVTQQSSNVGMVAGNVIQFILLCGLLIAFIIFLKRYRKLQRKVRRSIEEPIEMEIKEQEQSMDETGQPVQETVYIPYSDFTVHIRPEQEDIDNA